MELTLCEIAVYKSDLVYVDNKGRDISIVTSEGEFI